MLLGGIIGLMDSTIGFPFCGAFGPFGSCILGTLGGLVGGLEALATPCIPVLSALTLPCGEAIGGICTGLGDVISGCCGALP